MSSTNMWDARKFQENVGSLISRFNMLFLSDIAPFITNPNSDRKVSLRAIIALNTNQIQANLHNALNEIEKELRDNAHFLLKQKASPTLNPKHTYQVNSLLGLSNQT